MSNDLPIGWSRKTIIELGNHDPNTVQTGPFGAQLHSADYVDDGVPFILIKNMQENGISMTDMPHITEEDAERLSLYRLQTGDIVFSRVGRVGSCFLVREEHTGWVISGQLLRIRLPDAAIDPAYLIYALKSKPAQDYIVNTSVGSTRQSINTKILENLQVIIPAPKEQKTVALVLDTIDRAIRNTEQLIAKLKQMRNGLLHNLMSYGVDENGEPRDPVRYPEEFKNSEFGVIPEKWTVQPANQVCEAIIDCKNRTPPVVDKGFPVIRTSNIREGQFVLDGLVFTDPTSYEIWTQRGKPRPGDVVITREAPVGEACLIPNNMPNACLGQRTMLYQPLSGTLLNRYMLIALLSRPVQKYLTNIADGSTVGHVRVDDIRTLPIPIPPLEEQIMIADIFDSENKRISSEEEYLSKLYLLKHGLMDDLLTGEVRVTELVEEDADAVN